jgi:hypothetical protein
MDVLGSWNEQRFVTTGGVLLSWMQQFGRYPQYEIMDGINVFGGHNTLAWRLGLAEISLAFELTRTETLYCGCCPRGSCTLV